MENDNPHVGSKFDDYLKDEGMHCSTKYNAMRTVFTKKMNSLEITKKELAKKIYHDNCYNTTLEVATAIVDDFFNPDHYIMLTDLIAVVSTVGLELEINIIDPEKENVR